MAVIGKLRRPPGRRAVAAAVAVAGACAAGCVDDAGRAQASGNYTLALTNGANPCGFPGWEAGKQSTDIHLTLVQRGDSVFGGLGDWAGLYFFLAIGPDSLKGTLRGDGLDLRAFGNRSQQKGTCVYTTNASVHATLDGDRLSGYIDYLPATNGNPDCDSLATCFLRQAFNGVRAPEADTAAK